MAFQSDPRLTYQLNVLFSLRKVNKDHRKCFIFVLNPNGGYSSIENLMFTLQNFRPMILLLSIGRTLHEDSAASFYKDSVGMVP